ncbi:MAG: DUF885 domain-containing protein [Theionarchaea archaeon]|nr:DUF885 domain-containing protein [Theionarchaea archaeon]MBU7022023.1 DUF885 domain-containing protein [Theionarchaea archaeon]MBU7036139.1 DUF885 domain-containing protein [Theionarchaea archaeon]MBU7041795.1 DUF885 domain-containing protein [Theionarchaea archaeon]
MKMQKIAVLMMVLSFGGCIGQNSQSPVQSSVVNDVVADLKGLPVDEFFDESFKQLLLRYPEWVTAMGISEELGLRNDMLNDLSDEYIRETQELESAILGLLREYDRSSLTRDQQISYDAYEWYLDDLVRGHQFIYYNYPMHQFLLSYHDELVRLFTEYHTLADMGDCEDYIARLSSLDTQVDQLLAGMKKREELGIIPPTFIVGMTRQMLVEFLGSSSKDPSTIYGKNILFYTHLADKVEEIGLQQREKDALLEEALKAIEESVLPAYVDLLAYIEYLETVATSDAGVWKFPEGDEYYQYMLRHETSTDLTAEKIHQIGLEEVDRIQQEMREVFNQLGYPQDARISSLIERAITEGGFINTYNQSGKDEVVQTYEDILDEVSQRLDEVFDVRPTAELIVVGETGYGGGGGYFVQASLDGSRPGAFHTGIGNSLVPKYRMPTIAYHEAIPGHYFQISIAQEMDVPLFRSEIINNGYAEGWALYAEQLAYELGLYEDNPYGNIGHLHLELLRAVRLVTDTGIHYKKWTREEAKTYMKNIMGDDGSSGEVDRYVVLPAQATGYKVGMIKILELRQKAMDELGDKFDIKEFHHVILCNGGMPLSLLENVVQDYIDSKTGATAHLMTSNQGVRKTLPGATLVMPYINPGVTFICSEYRGFRKQ